MDVNTPTPAPIEGGEQAVDPLASEVRISRKRLTIAASVALLAAAISVGYSNYQSPDNVDKVEAIKSWRVKVNDRIFDPVEETVAAEPGPVEETVALAVDEKQAQPAPVVEIQKVIEYRDRPAPAVPKIHKSRSLYKPIQVADASAASGNVSSGTTQDTQAGNVVSQTGNGSAAGGTSSDGVTRGYASKLQNTDRLLTQGTDIPCILGNSINTQLAGDVTCTVARDIYSEDFSRVLVARGSTSNGEYGIGTTSGAVTRIGVIWGRIKTTDDMVAYLGSNATDQQGATGIPPNSVDYHFWQKYGTAFGVSMVLDALGNIGKTDTNADVVVNSATGVSSSIVNQIFEASIGIPTTRTALKGETILIHLKGDIEFEPLP